MKHREALLRRLPGAILFASFLPFLSVPASRAQSPDCNGNGIADDTDVRVERYGLVPRGHVLLGEQPRFLAAGDLDADGDMDLAALSSENDFTWSLNRGDGTFAPSRSRYAGTDFLRDLKLADMDGDGALDAVISSCEFLCGEPNVTILRNDGAAGFEVLARVPVANAAIQGVAVEYFDNDRLADFAFTDLSRVFVYRQRRDRSFELHWSGGPGGRQIIARDLDRDDDPDLVTDRVSILLNQGDGTMLPVFSLGDPGEDRSLVVNDFDGDSDLDLAFLPVAIREGKTLTLVRNLGRGEFRTEPLLTVEASALSLVAGGFDDAGGGPDIVTTNGSPGEPGFLSLFHRRDDHRFELTHMYPARAQTAFAVAMHLDNDHRPDLASIDFSGVVALHLNRPASTSSDCDRNFRPDECSPGYDDCDRNGIADVCDLLSGRAQDCNQNGVPDACELRAELAFASPELESELIGPAWIETGDLDGDGREEVVVSNGFLFRGDAIEIGRTLTVFRNDGGGGLERWREIDVGASPAGFALADLDGDAALDLAVAYTTHLVENVIRVFLQRGEAFLAAGAYPAEDEAAVVAADIDGDGDLDLVTRLSLYANRGDGAFDASTGTVFENLPLTIRARLAPDEDAADLDGDGNVDLVKARRDVGRVELRFGRSDGSLGEPVPLEAGVRPHAVVLSDLDGDGRSDIAVANRGTRDLSLFINDGEGGFIPALHVPAGHSPGFVSATRFDADGLPDLITAAHEGETIALVLNRSLPPAGVPDGCRRTLFRRGDVSDDFHAGLHDAIVLLNYLFLDSSPLRRLEAADWLNDGRVDISDPVQILNYVFIGGPPAALPGSNQCGDDPDPPGSPGDLGCFSRSTCASGAG